MVKKKENKMQTIKCPDCKNEMIVCKSETEGFFNWKCDECYRIIQLQPTPYFKWNCARPETPRRNPNNRR